MNTMIDSNRLIRGENASWMMLAKMGMRSGCSWRSSWLGLLRVVYARCGGGSPDARSAGGVGADPEDSLSLHGIVPAVAPRVASEQAPPGEHQASKYAVPADRLNRIARAGRLIPAAPGNRRGHEPPVEEDRGEDHGPGDPRCAG